MKLHEPLTGLEQQILAEGANPPATQTLQRLDKLITDLSERLYDGTTWHTLNLSDLTAVLQVAVHCRSLLLTLLAETKKQKERLYEQSIDHMLFTRRCLARHYVADMGG